MCPLLIVSQVMGDMRPASAASEAIEAEVSLKVWDVLHGTLRWASEADGPCEAGLCDLRGHRHTDRHTDIMFYFILIAKKNIS